MPLLNQLVCFQWLMSGTPSLFYFQRLLDPCRHVSYVRRPQETHQSPENYQPLADWRVRFKLFCSNEWLLQAFHLPPVLSFPVFPEPCLTSWGPMAGSSSLDYPVNTFHNLCVRFLYRVSFLLDFTHFDSLLPQGYYYIFFFSLPGQSPSSACMHAKLLQSCLSLLQLKDHSPPGSSVSELHRVNQWNLCCHGLCSRRKEDCVWYFLILLQHLSCCWFHSRHSANSHCGFKCI